MNLEITNVTPNSGSIFGNSTVKITGKYLYHSDLIPANINLAGFLFKFLLLLIEFKDDFIVKEHLAM